MSRDAAQAGSVSGLLYVPDLQADDACYNRSQQYVPANVTRRANLPSNGYTLVALAPWISVECTLSYLSAARSDPAHALIFYQANNGTATSTPHSHSSVWDLGDGDAWRTQHRFPVYAIPGMLGSTLMHQLSLYSGNMTEVPRGHDLSELPGIDPRDYVRLYTQIGLSTETLLPHLWIYVLIVAAALAGCSVGATALVHLVQRMRRESLRQRVESGEVNLEALGITRLRIPISDIERLPLFIYTSEDDSSPPTSPQKEECVSANGRDDLSEGSSSTRGSESQTLYTLSISKEHPMPELIPVDHRASHLPGVIAHRFLPYRQPACAICSDDFEAGISEIRELPCGHIFHSDCIDAFLSSNSSLCPVCRKSALPPGCCPTRITNAMVRRERNLRRVRSVVSVDSEAEALGGQDGVFAKLRRIRDGLF